MSSVQRDTVIPHFQPQFSSVQSLSHVQLSVTPWTAAHQSFPSITNSRSPPNPCPLSRWCHPTISSSVLLPSLLLPSIFPSIRVFSNESALCIRWPKMSFNHFSWLIILAKLSFHFSFNFSVLLEWFTLEIFCFKSIDSNRV